MARAADRRSGTQGAAHVSQGMLETAHSLSVDLLATEVVSEFRKRDVPSILLKGSSIAAWLYSDGEHRPYGDCDLLVPPEHAADARNALLALGFRYGYESLGPGELEEGLFWTRGLDNVDLHLTIKGSRAAPERVWAVLSDHVEEQMLCRSEVTVLTPPARAMHVALHAAHHGRREETPMKDLGRALAVVPFDTWTEAAEIAHRLDAVGVFATGLALLPAGQAVVDRLGIKADDSVEGLLRANTAPTVAFTLEELRSTDCAGARARLVARKLFPSRAYMRLYWPLARRGKPALALAYVQRLASKLPKLAPALIAWNRARRGAR